MSHTEYLGTRVSKQFHPKELKRIVSRALSLVDGISEPNPTVVIIAKVIIEDFGDVVVLNPKLNFKEATTAARLASASPTVSCEKWEHTVGASTAAKALELSAKIEMKDCSFGKAVIQMNRIIAEREKNRTGGIPTIGSKHGKKAYGPKTHRRSANDGKGRKPNAYGRRKAA